MEGIEAAHTLLVQNVMTKRGTEPKLPRRPLHGLVPCGSASSCSRGGWLSVPLQETESARTGYSPWSILGSSSPLSRLAVEIAGDPSPPPSPGCPKPSLCPHLLGRWP